MLHAAFSERPCIDLPEHRAREIAAAVKRLGNLQLLPSQENLEKEGMPFEAWITSRNAAYRGGHLIEDEADLWTTKMLPEFVRSREWLIRQKLLALTPRTVQGNAHRNFERTVP
ncbi:hypothetical protein M8756_16175 [Lutimaribacter sp. EGI FJ00015]|uniref:Uncharacterized protein n=1 Tax=Lutimaribacter degradans TaxID=2945989 RepID=A0ACC5ZZE4_9RHOB|nr:hypothetical protein [Lutimaribacter sp. EGI FJ00013]MCM2563672.1 hypothetical protein [Lutimaribacter sp. EGI FJ00013]MCO0614855.1 hypothetical protein [Lutimaribacter sp. EGI FJ00015]